MGDSGRQGAVWVGTDKVCVCVCVCVHARVLCVSACVRRGRLG